MLSVSSGAGVMGNCRLSWWRKWLKRVLTLLLEVILFSNREQYERKIISMFLLGYAVTLALGFSADLSCRIKQAMGHSSVRIGWINRISSVSLQPVS